MSMFERGLKVVVKSGLKQYARGLMKSHVESPEATIHLESKCTPRNPQRCRPETNWVVSPGVSRNPESV